jgi:transposase
MHKKYRVTLTLAEREELERLLARGKADVRKIKHAQILLKADEAESGPAWPDARIAEAFAAGITTVERVRQRFVEEGLASALSPYRGGKRLYERKLDGAQEAHLIALACSAPPDGQARWTLRLLAQRMVELAYVDTLSYETVRQTLKKERPPAAPEKDVVHSRQALGGVRLPHGRRAGGLPPPVRSQASGGVRGRDLQATDRPDPRAPADATGLGRAL